MPPTTELSGTELCDTEQSSIRPPRPEHSVGKNLHANFRTRSVVVVLISITVLPSSLHWAAWSMSRLAPSGLDRCWRWV